MYLNEEPFLRCSQWRKASLRADRKQGMTQVCILLNQGTVYIVWYMWTSLDLELFTGFWKYLLSTSQSSYLMRSEVSCQKSSEEIRLSRSCKETGPILDFQYQILIRGFFAMLLMDLIEVPYCRKNISCAIIWCIISIIKHRCLITCPYQSIKVLILTLFHTQQLLVIPTELYTQVVSLREWSGLNTGISSVTLWDGSFLKAGELRKQLMSYAEDFIVDLMHQGDQEVEQYDNANRATWAIVTPKSEDVSHSFPIYLPLLASPIVTAHPWMARIAVTLHVTGVRRLLDS